MAVINKQTHDNVNYLSFFIDGKKVDEPVEVDPDAGYIVVIVKDEDGKPIHMTASPYEQLKYDILVGHVTLQVNIGCPRHLDAQQVIDSVLKASRYKKAPSAIITNYLSMLSQAGQHIFTLICLLYQKAGKDDSFLTEVSQELSKYDYGQIVERLQGILAAELEAWEKSKSQAYPSVSSVTANSNAGNSLEGKKP